MDDIEIRRLIRAERRRNRGVIAGLLGCAFAVLGIVTLGIVFVPLAILCSLVGFVRAAGALSASGIAMSLLGCILSGIGAILSPSLLLLVGIMYATSQPGPVAGTPESSQMSSSSSSGNEEESGRSTGQQTSKHENPTDSLVSCGSGGCFPMNNSKAAREAADRANEENRRWSAAAAPKQDQGAKNGLTK